jgi:hypothetical protein
MKEAPSLKKYSMIFLKKRARLFVSFEPFRRGRCRWPRGTYIRGELGRFHHMLYTDGGIVINGAPEFFQAEEKIFSFTTDTQCAFYAR